MISYIANTTKEANHNIKQIQMRRRSPWMHKGSIVLVNGSKATITSIYCIALNMFDYVYHVECKLEGQKRSKNFHPNDLEELIISKTI